MAGNEFGRICEGAFFRWQDHTIFGPWATAGLAFRLCSFDNAGFNSSEKYVSTTACGNQPRHHQAIKTCYGHLPETWAQSAFSEIVNWRRRSHLDI